MNRSESRALQQEAKVRVYEFYSRLRPKARENAMKWLGHLSANQLRRQWNTIAGMTISEREAELEEIEFVGCPSELLVHRYRRKQADKYKNMSSEERAARREYARKYRLSNWYGMTVEEHDALLEHQGGVCAICKQEFESYCVDHNHETDEVRGLLCNDCNLGIGKLRDSIDSLQNAITYLNNPPLKDMRIKVKRRKRAKT